MEQKKVPLPREVAEAFKLEEQMREEVVCRMGREELKHIAERAAKTRILVSQINDLLDFVEFIERTGGGAKHDSFRIKAFVSDRLWVTISKTSVGDQAIRSIAKAAAEAARKEIERLEQELAEL